MSKMIANAELTQLASVAAQPVQTRVDRNFGLPTGLYVATVLAYLGFLGVLAACFMTGELALPMVMFVFYIVMVFGVPAIWARMTPRNDTAPLSWGQFANRGIMTETGQLGSGQAAVQVLILPALILFWGVGVAIIFAVVT